MKFQELLEIIKKYNGDGTDYAYSSKLGGSSSPDNTKNYSYSQETYEIYSPELKKEARKLLLNGHTEDGGICRIGASIGGKWYEYEKGDGNQPDKFAIRDISAEEKKEQEKRDEEQARRDLEQAERDKENREKGNFNFRDKKCAECGQEIDPSQGMIGSKPDREKEWIHFCSVGCSKKHSDKKHGEEKSSQSKDSPWEKNCASCNIKLHTTDCDYIEGDNKGNWYCSRECANNMQNNSNQRNNSDNNVKCAKCGVTPETYGTGCYEYFGVDGEIYCSNCLDKRPKKAEIEQKQTKLNALKNKLQSSTNPQEKKNLEQEIDKLERELKNQQNQNNSKSPQKGYGELIAGGVIIFAIFGVGLLVISKKKKLRAKK